MEIIRAEEIITSQWNQFLGSGGKVADAWSSDLGMYFEIEISIQNFGYEKDGNTYRPEWERHFFRIVEIAVTARHEVFVRVVENHRHRLYDQNIGDWKNTSNHDSCWRTDGLRVIWETLAEGWSHCYGHVPDEHRASMNAMYRYCHVNSGVFNKGAIQFVRIKRERDQKDSYRRILKEIRPVSFNITVDE